MARTAAAKAKVTEISNVSNDAAEQIAFQEPFTVSISLEGTAALLFHRWSVEGIDEKAKAAKGSKAKKTDDIESYLWRNDKGELCLPGEYLRMSIINAAKFRQDPRSPRKSAMDLFKAGVVCINELCTLGVKEPEFIDRRRVMVQRNGITRSRPALHAGWKATAQLMVNTPEYISAQLLNEVTQMAGRLIGVGDFRPSFGRFQVTNFHVIDPHKKSAA